MRDARNIFIILAVCCVIFFYGLGRMALTDPDETFYAETAREMLEAGEWATPLIFGEPQFEKPVLYYWLVEASFKFLGVNEFAARLPSVLFGIIGCIGIYYLAKTLFSALTGFVSSLVASTAVMYLSLARACVTDMVLMTFILLSFLFFFQGLKSERNIFYLLSSAMAALAVLTKGPVGVFLPFVTIAVYVTGTRQWSIIKKFPWVSAMIVFLAVSLPWYIIAYRLHGDLLVSEFFGTHNLTRFLHPEHRIGSFPLFYVPVILVGVFPWTMFLVFGAWNMFRKKEVGEDVKAPGAFLASWFFVVFLFFTASQTRLVTYIFPLFPALFIVTGRYLERFAAGGEGQAASMKKAYFSFIALSVAGLAGGYAAAKYGYPQVERAAVVSGLVYAAGMTVSLLAFLARRYAASFCALVVTVAAVAIPVVDLVLPVVEEYETSKDISVRLNDFARPDEAVGGECDHRRGIAFYSGRTDIVDIHPYNDLVEFVSRDDKVWGIIQDKHYDQVKREKPDLVSDPVYRAGEYVLITNEK